MIRLIGLILIGLGAYELLKEPENEVIEKDEIEVETIETKKGNVVVIKDKERNEKRSIEDDRHGENINNTGDSNESKNETKTDTRNENTNQENSK